MCVDLAKGMCLERFLLERWWARIDCTSGPPRHTSQRQSNETRTDGKQTSQQGQIPSKHGENYKHCKNYRYCMHPPSSTIAIQKTVEKAAYPNFGIHLKNGVKRYVKLPFIVVLCVIAWCCMIKYDILWSHICVDSKKPFK